ncbi:MAG TPA: hypothetical protein VLH10_20810 [Yinghuangia sp.]|uniref:helix-turn-helix domain-containing protein n=1 Tax=Yinghuangia sp. YIM S10712 TaxID=3436930 RepID=UPI002BA53929|nr:hypothetical protein [Yinghuangia sp.]
MAIRQGGGSSASGNVRLKALRHAMGWVSQQQLADAFEKKALECGLRLAVSVRQVRRWESADPPWPTPDYQKVLQELFGRPLADLGFTPPWQADLDAAPPPPTVPPQQPRAYGGALNGSADVPRSPSRPGRYRITPRVGEGQPGNGRAPQPQNGTLRRAVPPPPGSAPAPGLMPEPMHKVEPRADTLPPPSSLRPSGLILPGQAGPVPRPPGERPRASTPALLRAVDREERVGGLPDLTDLVPAPGRTGRLGSPVADQYARLTASYRQMYWVAPALMTYDPVVSHVLLGDKLLKAPGPSRPRRVLAASVSETAMLAGRIAFFDLGNELYARRFYQLAEQAAYEAQEPLLRQAVFAHQAFMPAFNGRTGEARALIARANHVGALADAGAPALMRSWLCAVNAEIESLVGDKDIALRLMDRAEDLLCHPDENEVPAWLDFFDSARLWGFRGGAELAAKRYDAAREALTDALGDLPASAAKQQAVTCADLARVAAASGDVDEASGMLSRALDALTRQWYATAMDRIWEVRGSLEPFKNAQCIRRLDEELAAWQNVEGGEEEQPPRLS